MEVVKGEAGAARQLLDGEIRLLLQRPQHAGHKVRLVELAWADVDGDRQVPPAGAQPVSAMAARVAAASIGVNFLKLNI